MKDLKGLIVVVVLLAAAAVGFVALQKRKGYALKVGEPAPTFVLPSLEGPPADLAALRGRVVLVNLWASWCAPCLEEMPSLERLHQKLKGEGLVVLGISADGEEKAIRDVLAKQPLTFPILRDPDGKTADKYHATGYPETYLVDKQGVLRETFIGPVEWDSADLVDRLRRLL
jgi:cytochrome c biogenesis protein CcmG/thiol:disulfide interchange protein DsbE